MQGKLALGWAAVQLLAAAGTCAGAAGEDALPRVGPDHPRLFLNRALVAALRDRMTPDQQRYLADLRKKVDGYPAAPAPPTPQTQSDPRNDWGKPAADAALLHLLTGDAQYLPKAAALLRAAVDWYGAQYRAGQPVSWYSSSRIGALCAYDWLYNDLTAGQRQEIGTPLLAHMRQALDPKTRTPGDGPSGPTAGFYGAPNLAWYAGLAFLGAGVDDEAAARMLSDGYRDHLAMFRYRTEAAGDDGGSATACVAYAGSGEYQRQECNFFHSWRAITGGEFAARFPRLALFPNWLLWNAIRGPDGQVLEFGTGDSWHRTNVWSPSSTYLAQFPAFYRDAAPEMCRVAGHLLALVLRGGEGPYAVYRSFLNNTLEQSVIPFLFPLPDAAAGPPALPDGLPRARHFPGLGQVVMNGAFDPWSTYCLFTAGSRNAGHKHYDENTFVLYRQGFLALDTGTRGGPYGPDGRVMKHELNYYHRTVAHNGILIRMEGEKYSSWVETPAEANNAGQNVNTAAEVLAFETNNHFTYVAGDATRNYHPDKCAQAVRQFVFLMPDTIVLFDRVASRKPDQQKTWLLHTQDEPQVRGDTFETTQGDGKIICRTLLPAPCTAEKIGGPDKEFWSDGRNWPLSPDREAEPRSGALCGRWRMEISAPRQQSAETFLHVIQVGDKNELVASTPSRLVREGGMVGVQMEVDGCSARVLFNEAGAVGGKIRLACGSRVLCDQALATTVQEQSALALDARRREADGPVWLSLRQGDHAIENHGEAPDTAPIALRLQDTVHPVETGRIRIRLDGLNAGALARVTASPDRHIADVVLDAGKALGQSPLAAGARLLSKRLLVAYRQPLSGRGTTFSRKIWVASAQPAPGAVFLSALAEDTWVALKGSYKWFNKDADQEGKPFALAGQTYTKGLMLAPPMGDDRVAFVEYTVPPECRQRTFRAVIGIGRTAGRYGSVTFRVKTAGAGGGWRLAYESPCLAGSDTAYEVAVPLQGSVRLRLECDGGPDINSDHSCWADARLE